MMTQGYLIETIIHRKLEERLATVPRTEKTTGLAGIGGFIERTMQDMEFDAILCTKCLRHGMQILLKSKLIVIKLMLFWLNGRVYCHHLLECCANA